MDGQWESQSANGSAPVTQKLSLIEKAASQLPQSPDPARTTVVFDSFSFIIRSSIRALDSLLVIIFHVYTIHFHVHSFSAFFLALYDRSTDRSPSLTGYIKLQLGIPSAAISMTQHYRRYCLPFGGLQGAHRCQNRNTCQSLRP